MIMFFLVTVNLTDSYEQLISYINVEHSSSSFSLVGMEKEEIPPHQVDEPVSRNRDTPEQKKNTSSDVDMDITPTQVSSSSSSQRRRRKRNSKGKNTRTPSIQTTKKTKQRSVNKTTKTKTYREKVKVPIVVKEVSSSSDDEDDVSLSPPPHKRPRANPMTEYPIVHYMNDLHVREESSEDDGRCNLWNILRRWNPTLFLQLTPCREEWKQLQLTTSSNTQEDIFPVEYYSPCFVCGYIGIWSHKRASSSPLMKKHLTEESTSLSTTRTLPGCSPRQRKIDEQIDCLTINCQFKNVTQSRNWPIQNGVDKKFAMLTSHPLHGKESLSFPYEVRCEKRLQVNTRCSGTLRFIVDIFKYGLTPHTPLFSPAVQVTCTGYSSPHSLCLLGTPDYRHDYSPLLVDNLSNKRKKSLSSSNIKEFVDEDIFITTCNEDLLMDALRTQPDFLHKQINIVNLYSLLQSPSLDTTYNIQQILQEHWEEFKHGLSAYVHEFYLAKKDHSPINT